MSRMSRTRFLVFGHQLVTLTAGETCNSMTVLQSFPPEICSLICQDPILERLDLNSICYISHAFRNEAQRELSYHFPFLRGARSAKFWSHSLSPHAAKGIKGLVLLLPSDFDIILNFILSLYMCVNLKELVVLFEPSSSTHIMSQMFPMFPPIIQLTKLVNGYFSQDNQGNSTFIALLRSQRNLELLELHLGEIGVFKSQLSLDCLKTLGCPPQFLDTSYSLTRLRLNFGNSSDNCEIDILGRVLHRNLTRNMKSFKLAIFFNQEQSRFPEIIRAVAESHIYIQHLKIHQFLPTQVRP